MSRLLHYSKSPIEAVRSIDFRAAIPDGCYVRTDKPRGFWVSVEGEDDWRSWCESESYGNPSEQLCYEVVLKESAPILRIESEQALRDFSRDYGLSRYSDIPVKDTVKWLSLATRVLLVGLRVRLHLGRERYCLADSGASAVRAGARMRPRPIPNWLLAGMLYCGVALLTAVVGKLVLFLVKL